MKLKIIKPTTFLTLAISILSSLYLAEGDNKTRTIVAALFKNYDGEIRPTGHNGTGPVIISVNFFLRSVEDVVETKSGLEWKPQLIFRMQWYDERLAFKSKAVGTPLSAKPFITIVLSMSKKIWRPDVFFSNANDVKVHKELTPNEYWRVFPDGQVLYSVRLTISLLCPVNMRKFPHDKQTCVIKMASYGYTAENIVLIWKAVDPIQISSTIDLQQFTMKEFTANYCDSQTNTGVYSCLTCDIVIQRDSGIYFDKVYIPFSVGVITAWLTFWLHPVKAAVPRVLILIACLLYLRTSGDQLRDQLPSVPYSTAFDRWSSGCCFFIFVSICEFIGVSFLAAQTDHGSLSDEVAIRNSISDVRDLSLVEESSQLQPQHGDINLLRKLHIQAAYAKLQKGDWYVEKLDMLLRIGYPIGFAIFATVYTVGMYVED